MAEKASNVVLNFKMSGQVEYAKTIRDINAIMNAAASEYRTHIAAMGKDADASRKLAAEKKKLEIQMEAAKERTKMLRTEYEAMAKDTNTSTGQLANKYKQLQNSERAEIALANALERVNEEMSDQAEEARKTEEALNKLESEAESLETQTEKLNAEYELQKAQLGENASESDKLKLKMEHLNDAHELAGEKVKNYEEQLELAKKQYGENSTEVDKYETQLLEARTAEQQLANEIEATNKQLKEQEDVLKKTGEKLKNTGDKMKDVGKDMSMKVTAPIVGFGTLATKAAVDFESAFAGVRKTVDATEEQFADLEQGIRDMSKELPASASEIAGVAESAGQLGIATEHILTFTQTMIDLGEATNMTSEQAATEFARFANIVGMSQADFDKLGSTVVDLGNNLATTESEIVSMGMRLAGAGAQIGLTEAQIMAFSGALSSVGIEAEAGGSAFSKVMVNMQLAAERGGEELEAFANVAGMSASEFKQAYEEDAAGALITFIEGLATAEERGESAIGVLDEMGITEVRMRDALLRAAGASDVFTESLKIGTNAWKENTALSDEAAERYKTTAAQLSMLKNEITDLAIDIGNIVIPMLLSVVDAVKPWIERFKEMDESTQKFIVVLAGIAAAIGPVLVVLGTLISSIGSIVGAISTVVGWFGGWTAILGGLKAALVALTGPIGITIAIIGALIAVGVLLYKNWDTIKEKAIEIWSFIVDWFKQVWENIEEDVMTAWNAIVGIFEGVWELIKNVFLGGFLFLFMLITGQWDEILQVTEQIWNNIIEALNQIWENIKIIFEMALEWLNEKTDGKFSEILEVVISYMQMVWENIKAVWEFIQNTFTNVLDFLKALVRGDFQGMRDAINNQMENIKNLISTIWNNVKKFFADVLKDILRNVKQKFEDMVKAVAEKMTETYNNIKNAWDDAVEFLKNIDLKQTGKDIIDGLIQGIKDKVNAVKNAMKDVTDAITNKVKSILDIQSPSRVMMEIGRFVTEGLGIGIEQMKKYAVDKTASVASAISGVMKDGIELPDMEIGTVVRQPANFGETGSGFGGTTSNEYNYQTLNMDGLFNGAVFNVRDDNDIQKIAKELNDYIRMGARKNGVIMT